MCLPKNELYKDIELLFVDSIDKMNKWYFNSTKRLDAESRS